MNIYYSEPPKMLEAITEFYDGLSLGDQNRVAAVVSDSYTAAVSDGVMNRADFLAVVPDWAEYSKQAEREFIEQGNTVVAHFSFPLDGNGDVHGCAVHQFSNGLIESTKFY